jgi:hypothetical protein
MTAMAGVRIVPRLSVWALAAWTASVATGCGGRTEVTGEGMALVRGDAGAAAAPVDAGWDSVAADAGSDACSFESSTTNPVENCARYCGLLRCAGCAAVVGTCTTLCEDRSARGTLKAACLACVLDNEKVIFPSLTCNSFVSGGADGGGLFVLTYPTAACGTVCGP